MKKLLIYYNFILVTIMVIAGFISAKSSAQLVSAIVFYPLSLYFLMMVIPKKNKALVIPELQPVPKKLIPPNEEEKDQEIVTLKKEGVDIDRRKFLKLVGSAGMSLFMLALFTKKAQAAFFGSMPGPGTVALKDASGNLINPAEKLPTDGYRVCQVDDSSPSYYGFVNKDGAWFIMKEDSTTGDYRYVKGDTSFSASWTTRAELTYGYFDAVF